ncbi:unnamed protein product [Rotaria sp. Silwood1]|nr:unnamed protein product [Rotaria sp. Silwood1]CAF5027769.1 unnamed protein product [Rotaria sp. Silwood1]
MASAKKREHQLVFKPLQTSAEDKIDMLTDLLAGQCKPSEKINYLSDRAEVYCDEYQWTNALKDIAEIELLKGGKLNNILRAIKTKASVQLDLEKIRHLIGNAIASGGNTTVSHCLHY